MQVQKFNSLTNAENALLHCLTPSKFKIVLGDDNRFWLVSNRDAMKLMEQGFELAD